ncbi:LADA_0C09714g1_1 [Lachancea dasiensis]|uniref:LADA_0C09714g1_1 n=1 Tax=Lachancea dasiensis TaxID=1072105 RepID=A0A1G4J0N7_9SACH|nr:LADA_0C09714g1_1 [Lachancea dasiensis]
MQKPFQGLTFCPTALPEEVSRNLSRKITKLGGGYSKDLTKSVNVLIVGSVATNKYRFAVQNRFDIAFLAPDALDSIYDLWLTGEEISMESHSNYTHIKNGKDRMLKVLQTRYQLGPLKDFVIFIGRVNDTRNDQFSTDVLDKLCLQLGVHSCNTRHFVKEVHWSRPTVFVTDHSKGARVDAARLQGLPIVHPKWISDCYKRDALLDFAYYLLDNCLVSDYESIGQGACMCWEEIEARRDSSSTSLSDDALETRQTQRAIRDKFASDGDRLWNSVMLRKSKIVPSDVSAVPKAASPKETPKIFENGHFYLSRFPAKQRAILEKIISQNGGNCYEVTTSKADLLHPSFLVVPSSAHVRELTSFEQSFSHQVTEFFFERCLHYKKLLKPDPWCSPFLSEFHIKPCPGLSSKAGGSNTLKVAITGFQGVELLHITKMLEALLPSGLELKQTLNKDTDILLINLGALNSIPETHTLWQNHLAPMFLENRKIAQNQIHRNSMKRKIDFIKLRHSIPVVTAGFIIELFARGSKLCLEKPTTKIHFNDVNWCISCPRGEKDAFYLELHNGKGMETYPADGPPYNAELSIRRTSKAHQSVGHSRNEIISRLDNSTIPQSSCSPVERVKRAYTDSNVGEKELGILPQPKIPRLAPAETLQPIQRSTSWGRMLSDQARRAEDQLEIESNSAMEEEEQVHTQVTYGSPQGKPTSAVSVRRITRQHMREVDT